MRHRKKGRKLGTDASHTKAMKKGLVAALLANDRIKTTLPRAKEIRGDVDRVITWAKRGDIHSRRLAIAAVGDKDLVHEIFEKVEQGMFEGRNGGYTRIYKLGNRKGDNAPMCIMELVTEPVAGAVSVAKEDKADKPKEEKALKGKAAQKAAADELNAKFQFDEDEADKAAEEASEEAEETAEEASAETEEAAEETTQASEDAAEEATSEASESE